jgi:uncharacterized membrane protein
MALFAGSILAVALATIFFVGAHFLMSHPLRGTIQRLVGAKAFPAVYAVTVGIGLAWMIFAHSRAPYVALWGDPIWARHLLLLVMIPSTLLVVIGNGTPSPGVAGAERKPFDYSEGLGIHAIVRHPGLWGFALWALGHMLANGDAATVILTAGIATLAFGGMAGIDARKSRSFPETYPAFRAHTSNIPFAAMLDGRTWFNFAKIGIRKLAIAIVVYFALLFGHRWLIGVSALPV